MGAIDDRVFAMTEWTPHEPPENVDDSDLPYVTHSGVVKIGPAELRCYQLSDGNRVIDANDVEKFLGVPGTEKSA